MLISLAVNTIGKRSFSAENMATYHNTAKQINWCMIFHVHKEKTTSLANIGNEFVHVIIVKCQLVTW